MRAGCHQIFGRPQPDRPATPLQPGRTRKLRQGSPGSARRHPGPPTGEETRRGILDPTPDARGRARGRLGPSQRRPVQRWSAGHAIGSGWFLAVADDRRRHAGGAPRDPGQHDQQRRQRQPARARRCAGTRARHEAVGDGRTIGRLRPRLLLAVFTVAALVPARAAAPNAGDATIQRVGFGGGHRHGHSTDTTSTRKPEPPHAPPPPETAEQHKAYLKRYGFGL